MDILDTVKKTQEGISTGKSITIVCSLLDSGITDKFNLLLTVVQLRKSISLQVKRQL